jgi:hypothetical protein
MIEVLHGYNIYDLLYRRGPQLINFYRAWVQVLGSFFRWFSYIAVYIYLYEQSQLSTLSAEYLLYTYIFLSCLSIYPLCGVLVARLEVNCT